LTEGDDFGPMHRPVTFGRELAIQRPLTAHLRMIDHMVIASAKSRARSNTGLETTRVIRLDERIETSFVYDRSDGIPLSEQLSPVKEKPEDYNWRMNCVKSYLRAHTRAIHGRHGHSFPKT
jgi:hypothetical protein